MYAKVENQRLLYIQLNEWTLEVRNIEDSVKMLPRPTIRISSHKEKSSLIGSSRYLHQYFQNAIAIAMEFHLHSNQQPQDRPDIVEGLYNPKQNELMNDLINANIMG